MQVATELLKQIALLQSQVASLQESLSQGHQLHDADNKRIRELEGENAKLREALTGKLTEDDAGNEFTYVMVLKERIKILEAREFACMQHGTGFRACGKCFDILQSKLDLALVALEQCADAQRTSPKRRAAASQAIAELKHE